jgi:hypothetical protein
VVNQNYPFPPTLTRSVGEIASTHALQHALQPSHCEILKSDAIMAMNEAGRADYLCVVQPPKSYACVEGSKTHRLTEIASPVTWARFIS